MPFLPSLSDGGPDVAKWSLPSSNGKLNLGSVLFCVLCAACIGMLAVGPLVRLFRPRKVGVVGWLQAAHSAADVALPICVH